MLLLAAACSHGVSREEQEASGGMATVHDDSSNAFSFPIPSLTSEERRAFFVGNSFFNDNWVTAPASTDGRDGLGPLFNAQSCSSCHFRDGRGRPPESPADPVRGLLIRLSIDQADNGHAIGDPRYGDQIQDRGINGVEPEGSIRIEHVDYPVAVPEQGDRVLQLPVYAIDLLAYGPLAEGVMMSPRVAPQLPGVGLLEAIDEATILALHDPDDADGDGISGRANYVVDVASGTVVLGRFGWKANVPSLRQQNASAFVGDIGITSELFPDDACLAGQTACIEAPSGGTPEVDDQKLDRITFYTSTLAVPARRMVDEPQVRRGEQIFNEIGCGACHLPTLTTGRADVAALTEQVIHAYTDLLLHDMGPGLSDERPDFLASGREWRTAPLWGLGLVETVNDHTRFMHDGRARSVEEAILWHGGEAEAARDRAAGLNREQLDELLAFLDSL
jgi:CxxC motif-containing protein (DUF1111 family)